MAYRIGSTFYRVAASGGASTVIANAHESFTSGADLVWTEDDRILFTTGSRGILSVSALGGDPVEVIPKAENEGDLHEPSVLPGQRGYLFVVHLLQGGPNQLAVFADGERRILLELDRQRLWTPRYSSTGHILFRRTPENQGIWALPFSLASLQATGEPFLIAPDATEPCPGPDGLLAYRSGGEVSHMQLAWIARDGSLQATLTDAYTIVGHQTISPNGQHIAVSFAEDANGDPWVLDLARGTRQRLSSDPAWEVTPTWSPDGKTVYFVNVSDGSIRARRADGTGAEQFVHAGYTPDASMDGAFLVYEVDNGSAGSVDIHLLELPADSTSVSRPLLTSDANESVPRISPTDAYLAYASDESGRSEVYLTRFPSGEGKWQVSVGGGRRPRWDPAGGRLYYVSADAIMEVDVSERQEPQLGIPRELFKLETAGVQIGRASSYDVDRGGKRFVMSYDASTITERPTLGIVLVENWFQEFAKSAKRSTGSAQ